MLICGDFVISSERRSLHTDEWIYTNYSQIKVWKYEAFHHFSSAVKVVMRCRSSYTCIRRPDKGEVYIMYIISFFTHLKYGIHIHWFKAVNIVYNQYWTQWKYDHDNNIDFDHSWYFIITPELCQLMLFIWMMVWKWSLSMKMYLSWSW